MLDIVDVADRAFEDLVTSLKSALPNVTIIRGNWKKPLNRNKKTNEYPVSAVVATSDAGKITGFRHNGRGFPAVIVHGLDPSIRNKQRPAYL
jgi:hypothetical protein